MKDTHFTSHMFTRAGALMSISGVLLAVCAEPAYRGILLASAACMFFAARSFRIVEDREGKDNMGKKEERQST